MIKPWNQRLEDDEMRITTSHDIQRVMQAVIDELQAELDTANRGLECYRMQLEKDTVQSDLDTIIEQGITIAELRAENAALFAANLDCMDHYNDLRADLDRLKQQEPSAWVEPCHLAEMHKLDDPWQIVIACTRRNTASKVPLYLAAGARGHTREQIGLMLDERREAGAQP